MTTNEEIKNFAEKSIPLLKSYGYIKNNHLVVWGSIIAILWLSTLGLFYYAGNEGWFNSIVDQVVDLKPKIDVNSTTNNDFEMNNPTTNENNFTIYVNNFVECP